MAHGFSISNYKCIIFDGKSASIRNSFFSMLRKLIQMHIAWSYFTPCAGNSYEWFRKITIPHPYSPQHSSVGCSLHTSSHVLAYFIEFHSDGCLEYYL